MKFFKVVVVVMLVVGVIGDVYVGMFGVIGFVYLIVELDVVV